MTLEKESVTQRNTGTGGNYTRDPEEESLRNMRRQRDREMYDEIKFLKEENNHYALTITVLEISIKELRKDFENYVMVSREALATAQVVANAGFVGKSVVYLVISVTAAIGGIATVLELIRRWKV